MWKHMCKDMHFLGSCRRVQPHPLLGRSQPMHLRQHHLSKPEAMDMAGPCTPRALWDFGPSQGAPRQHFDPSWGHATTFLPLEQAQILGVEAKWAQTWIMHPQDRGTPY
mmetsp:Transcript_46652/g.83504  ORF Transcript_46652/g.83504 Transcript_46652/m.83504 type:complete len:109 (-) Transcript_46652:180-506(-)